MVLIIGVSTDKLVLLLLVWGKLWQGVRPCLLPPGGMVKSVIILGSSVHGPEVSNAITSISLWGGGGGEREREREEVCSNISLTHRQ